MAQSLDNTKPRTYGQLPGLGELGPLSERLCLALENAIIANQLEPGSHLHADDLAQHFGVSRIPVREALRELHVRRWVEIRPRHGAFVRERSLEEMEQLFELRVVLEAQCTRWAAARRSDEQLLRLEELIRQGTQAARDRDVGRSTSLNAEFHSLIADCTANDLLAESVVALSKRVRWYFATVAQYRHTASWEEHERIVGTLRRRDEEDAVRVVLAHIEATHQALRAGFRTV